MSRHLAYARWTLAAALLLTGCASGPARAPATHPPAVAQPPAAPSASAPSAGSSSVKGLAAAIAADAAKSEHPATPDNRAELAAAAMHDAQACIALAPQAAPCLYGQAVALGLTARAHPTQALSSLNQMLQVLASAETADPNYDHAGPARVRALVLARSPGWPLGPGDPQAAVVAAQRAVKLAPRHPPNLLALAEAQQKAGDAAGARESFAAARAAAEALPQTADRDGWVREAEDGLAHR